MPGIAKDDSHAFELVHGRLTADVGGILKRIGGDCTPFWALCRCLFPIADAIADLVHRDAEPTSTAKRLILFLRDDLESIRTGYKPLAATLTMLYRHSLIHTDEMRILKTKGRVAIWNLSFGDGIEIPPLPPHLLVKQESPTHWRVHFNGTTFYNDLAAFLVSAKGKTWGGKVRDRYNSWLELDLDAKADTYAEKTAVAEIAAFR